MEQALMNTVLAGLATGVGGVLAVWQKPTPKALGMAQGFAAGVMLCVALADLMPGSAGWYREVLGPRRAALAAASLLAMGMALAALMGRCLPEDAAPQTGDGGRARAMRSAWIIGLALLLHNLPEGVLTLFAGAADGQAGLRMALAVALHNLPEGLAVAMPLYYAAQSRARAVAAALASGLAEPFGAMVAWLFLGPRLSLGLLNGLMLTVGGVMIWVSLAELWPQAADFAGKGRAAAGTALGILVMTIGIVLLS